MITFVAFHIDIERDYLEKDTPLDRDNFYDYQQTIDLMFKSVSKFHPNCEKVILTDLLTDFSYLSTDIRLIRTQINSQEIMLSRLALQYNFLQAHNFESDVIFLDTDILVNENLESLFAENQFDLALTIREDNIMPINGGIIYISNKNKKSVISFFDKLHFLYTNKYKDKSQWWGDQYVLAEAINWSHGIELEPSLIDIEGVEILLLECDIYNFSPDYESNLDVVDLKGKKILHFKGPRKKYMGVYWENYLSLYGSQNWQLKNSILEQQVQELQSDRLYLKTEIKRLQSEHKEVQRKMKDKLIASRTKNESLLNQIQELKNTIQKFKNTNSGLSKHIKTLARTYANGIFFDVWCVTLGKFFNVAMRLIASRTNHRL